MKPTLAQFFQLAEGQTYDTVKQVYPSGFEKTRPYRYDETVVMVCLDPDPSLAPTAEMAAWLPAIIAATYDTTGDVLDGIDRVYAIIEAVQSKASAQLSGMKTSQEVKDFIQTTLLSSLIINELIAQQIVSP